MVIHCEEVWQQVSSYLDGELEPGLRAALEEHLHGCKRCTAVVEGTRNVIRLYSDERMLDVPLGFSRRLHRKLEDDLTNGRRGFFGWMVAAAAAILVAGGFELAKSSGMPPVLRSEHAEPGKHVPPDLIVIVAEDGKTFHRAGCPFIHDAAKAEAISARAAIQQGYAPCVRCMKQYLG